MRGKTPLDGPHKLERRYRAFGDEPEAQGSQLSARVARAIADSPAALAALAEAPKRKPAAVLAGLHYLALAGQAPQLRAAYASGDLELAATAAVDTLVRMADAVMAAATRWPLPSHPPCLAVLHPAIAWAAHRAAADTVGLVELGCETGLNLTVGTTGVSYSNGQRLGPPTSPAQVTARVVGPGRLPQLELPPVMARVGVGRAPLDMADPDAARWVRACMPPDLPEGGAHEAAIAVAAASPPRLLQGSPAERLGDAVGLVPAGTLPVVITTWTLARMSLEGRLRFLQQLDRAGAARPVAWVSVEGVGVAPGVPTMGDRPASGHSIIGVAELCHSGLRVQAAGRCWSRGRMLSWLAPELSAPKAASAG